MVKLSLSLKKHETLYFETVHICNMYIFQFLQIKMRTDQRMVKCLPKTTPPPKKNFFFIVFNSYNCKKKTHYTS